MRKHLRRPALSILAVLALAALVAAAAATAKPKPGPKENAKADRHDGRPDRGNAGRLDHVFVIMLENHSKSSVIGDANAPYITSLAQSYATAPSYYGVTHPSQPNYVATISGSNWFKNDDNPNNTYDHTNLVDQLEASHLSWAAYMESMPSVGFTGTQYPASTALYSNKHNPFVLFDDIRNDPSRLAHVKPYTSFARDMAGRDVPSFVWITPNQCHDMHGGVAAVDPPADGTPCPYGSAKDDPNDASLKQKADAFVKGAVDTIMRSSAWTSRSSNTAIFIVTDENDFTGNSETDGWESADGCCDSPILPPGYQFLGSNGQPDGTVWHGGMYGGGLIPAIVMANHGKQGGYADPTPFNHYSLLATVEDNWHLGFLANASDRRQVPLMTSFFTR